MKFLKPQITQITQNTMSIYEICVICGFYRSLKEDLP